MSEKRIEKMTFEELVDLASRDIHSGLLEGGGHEFKARVYLWLGQAIYWDHELNKREAQSGKSKKDHRS